MLIAINATMSVANRVTKFPVNEMNSNNIYIITVNGENRVTRVYYGEHSERSLLVAGHCSLFVTLIVAFIAMSAANSRLRQLFTLRSL